MEASYIADLGKIEIFFGIIFKWLSNSNPHENSLVKSIQHVPYTNCCRSFVAVFFIKCLHISFDHYLSFQRHSRSLHTNWIFSRNLNWLFSRTRFISKEALKLQSPTLKQWV